MTYASMRIFVQSAVGIVVYYVIHHTGERGRNNARTPENHEFYLLIPALGDNLLLLPLTPPILMTLTDFTKLIIQHNYPVRAPYYE